MSAHCIRTATPDDGPWIAYIRVITWRAAYHGIVPQDYLDGMDIVAESSRWSEALKQVPPSRRFFVAEMDAEGEHGSRVAGYAICGPNREGDDVYTGELYAIYVLPEYQRLGLGRELFRAVTGWLAEQGHKNMILYVLRDNAPSRRFYEAQGGKLVSEQLIDTGGVMLAEVGYGYELSAG